MTELCLATVTSSGFVPATMVMLYSFVRHHPGVHVSIVIIHDNLPIEDRRRIGLCFDGVEFLQVEASIRRRAVEVCASRADLASREARFFSLDAFRLRGYCKLLFVDSDVLFRGSLAELFHRAEPLLCCGEALYYAGGARRPWTLEPVDDPSITDGPLLYHTFNAGMMLIDGSLLHERHHLGLKALLNAKRFATIKARITDQAIFNLYFAGSQTLLGASYNYLLPYPELIARKEQVSVADAKVLHYCSPAKPWVLGRMLESATHNPTMIKALAYWSQTFVELLQHLHLREQMGEMHTFGEADTVESNHNQ